VGELITFGLTPAQMVKFGVFIRSTSAKNVFSSARAGFATTAGTPMVNGSLRKRLSWDSLFGNSQYKFTVITYLNQ